MIEKTNNHPSKACFFFLFFLPDKKAMNDQFECRRHVEVFVKYGFGSCWQFRGL